METVDPPALTGSDAANGPGTLERLFSTSTIREGHEGRDIVGTFTFEIEAKT